jgi:hypothetical protein
VSPGSKDNPLFIQKMFEFFKANADSIAYENYFNQRPRHQLNPGNLNPRASAKYKELWGRGGDNSGVKNGSRTG